MMSLNTSLLLFILCILICNIPVFSINILSKYKNASFSDITYWGTYKPHLLHGITEKSLKNTPLTFSLIIEDPSLFIPSFDKFKTRVSEIQTREDEKTHVDYIYHNGFDYAEQNIMTDRIPVNLSTTFLKSNIEYNHQSWYSMTEVHPKINHRVENLDKTISIYYAVILENHDRNSIDKRYIEYDDKKMLITIKNSDSKYSSGEEYITLSIYKNLTKYHFDEAMPNDESQLSVNYYILPYTENRSNIWDLKPHFTRGITYDYIIRKAKLNNVDQQTIGDGIIIQISFNIYSNISILYAYDSLYPKYGKMTLDSFINECQLKRAEFLDDFLETFQIENDMIPKQHMKLSISALSNLLGGLSFYTGSLPILNQNYEQPSYQFFTSTPSRHLFPRGFLWDEGFHNLLICKWSRSLCLETMSSWFNSQLDNGWIPREQARGSEIQSMIPPEFLIQNPIENNPPTLMLAIESMILDPNDELFKWLDIYYVKIKKWWKYFYDSQIANNNGLFAWYGKPFQNSIWFFGSGLDDYPRNNFPYTSKYHLDLHIWQIIFLDSLVKIANKLEKYNDVVYFKGLQDNLIFMLNKYFKDNRTKLYYDIQQYSWNKLLFVNHIGYVNLFPIMFGLIKNDDIDYLDSVLDLIDINGDMYSDYGILSLSRKDQSFRANNDYWTGPIWVNCNYLVIKGLIVHYKDNARAQIIAQRLKDNLIRNMVLNYEKTGYIWENYNEITGQGQGSHPFTGWSTLITLLISDPLFQPMIKTDLKQNFEVPKAIEDKNEEIKKTVKETKQKKVLEGKKNIIIGDKVKKDEGVLRGQDQQKEIKKDLLIVPKEETLVDGNKIKEVPKDVIKKREEVKNLKEGLTVEGDKGIDVKKEISTGDEKEGKKGILSGDKKAGISKEPEKEKEAKESFLTGVNEKEKEKKSKETLLIGDGKEETLRGNETKKELLEEVITITKSKPIEDEFIIDPYLLMEFLIWGIVLELATYFTRYFKGFRNYVVYHVAFLGFSFFLMIIIYSICYANTLIAGNTVRTPTIITALTTSITITIFNFSINTQILLNIVLYSILGLILIQIMLGLCQYYKIKTYNKIFEDLFTQKKLHRYIGTYLIIFSKLYLLLSTIPILYKYTTCMTIVLRLLLEFGKCGFWSMGTRILTISNSNTATTQITKNPNLKAEDDFLLSSDQIRLLKMINKDSSYNEIRKSLPGIKWIILKNNIYDITDILHPGGNFIFEYFYGKEIYAYYYGLKCIPFLKKVIEYKHSVIWRNMLKQRKIGEKRDNRYEYRANNTDNSLLFIRTNDTDMNDDDARIDIGLISGNTHAINDTLSPQWILISTSPINKKYAWYYFRCDTLAIQPTSFHDKYSLFGKYFVIKSNKQNNRKHNDVGNIKKFAYFSMSTLPRNVDLTSQLIKYFNKITSNRERHTKVFIDNDNKDQVSNNNYIQFDNILVNLNSENNHSHYLNMISDIMPQYMLTKDDSSKQTTKDEQKTLQKANNTNNFKLLGPLGDGLDLQDNSIGLYVIICEGISIMSYLDLLHSLLIKNMLDVVSNTDDEMNDENEVNKLKMLISKFGKVDFLSNDFKVILIGEFDSMNDIIGIEIIKKLIEIRLEYQICNFDAKIRIKDISKNNTNTSNSNSNSSGSSKTSYKGYQVIDDSKCIESIDPIDETFASVFIDNIDYKSILCGIQIPIRKIYLSGSHDFIQGARIQLEKSIIQSELISYI